MCEKPDFADSPSCTKIFEEGKKEVNFVPNLKKELNNAKAVLQETALFCGDNLFDHLSEIIKRVIDERPPNVMDYFEEYSRNMREQKFRWNDPYNAENLYELPRNFHRAQKIMSMFNLYQEDEPLGDEELEEVVSADISFQPLEEIARPISTAENVMILQHFWHLCGFGFHVDEVFLLSYSIQRFRQQNPLVKTCRFWGKIYGIHKSYYILETTLTEKEVKARLADICKEIRDYLRNYKSQESLNQSTIMDHKELIPGSEWRDKKADCELLFEVKQPPLPTPIAREDFIIPPEPIGVGVNEKVYFVCSELMEDWIELPLLRPEELNKTRMIKKLLTGNLDSDISAYPDFPYKERVLLRAMISRITASTYAAPENYYKVGKRPKDLEEEEECEEENDEEEEEEEYVVEKRIEPNALLVPNKKFCQRSLTDLMKVDKWVHVRPAILEQGRVLWFDKEKMLKAARRSLQNEQGDGDEECDEDEECEEEEEECEEESAVKKPQGEFGPELLTKCSQDTFVEMRKPTLWSTRMASSFNLTNKSVILRSNLWPGAYNIVENSDGETILDHIYVGWGLKYCARNTTIKHIPMIQDEYPTKQEVIEATDPTAQDEENYRLALAALAAKKAMGTQEEVEEECDDEDDDDDDDDDEDDDGCN